MNRQGHEPPRGRLGTWALCAFYITAAPFAVGGGLALAPAQGLAGLLGAPWRRLWRQPVETWLWLAALFAFVAWVAASAFWSADTANLQGARFASTILLGLLFAAGCGADAESRRRVRAAGVGFALVLIAMLAVEAFLGMPLNRMDQPEPPDSTLMRNPSRGATVLAVAVWGLIAALAGGKDHERWTWRVLLFGAVLLSTQFATDANMAAMAMGAAAYCAAYLAPRLAVLTLSAGLAGWMLAAPWVMPTLLSQPLLQRNLPDSWMVRTEIWSFVCARIREHPIIGAGLDASRLYPEAIQRGDVVFRQISLHPHSVSLQVWFETGAVGAGLAALVILGGGAHLARRLGADRQVMAGACGAAAAAGVIANISYGAWQEWWIATLFLAAGLVAAARR